MFGALLGSDSICHPTRAGLTERFGTQPLIGKYLAILADVRFNGGHKAADIQQILLSVTGEDSLTIDRKNIGPWQGKLPLRFMLLANELPRFTDAAGALPGRFLILKFTHDFSGHEDRKLTDKLKTELSGILNWAIEAGGICMSEVSSSSLMPPKT